jgi:hypothetical protein
LCVCRRVTKHIGRTSLCAGSDLIDVTSRKTDFPWVPGLPGAPKRSFFSNFSVEPCVNRSFIYVLLCLIVVHDAVCLHLPSSYMYTDYPPIYAHITYAYSTPWHLLTPIYPHTHIRYTYTACCCFWPCLHILNQLMAAGCLNLLSPGRTLAPHPGHLLPSRS